MDWWIWLVILLLLLFSIIAIILTIRRVEMTQYYIQNVATQGYLIIESPGNPTLTNNYVSASGNIGDMYSQWYISMRGGLNHMTLTNVFTGNSLNYSSATSGTIITCSYSPDQNSIFFTQNMSGSNFYFRSSENTDLAITVDATNMIFPGNEDTLYLGPIGTEATIVGNASLFTFYPIS